MNINEKAIEMFEQNEYEKAMELFQRAVHESRGVQSLNNLAWMYFYEEENDDKALELIKEVVKLNPSSYFPYNILGEIYIKQKKWEEAKEVLQKSISIQPSNEAYHNVAVAHYNLGELEKASEFFLRVAGDSDIIMYNYVKCLIDLGRTTEAKEKLDAFNRESDNFVGEINVADLYVELNCYKEAIEWFEKGYKEYWKSPNWMGRFVYALYKA
ncbi:tetratricopeptide repeat protein, partial [Bacillus toyonensis]